MSLTLLSTRSIFLAGWVKEIVLGTWLLSFSKLRLINKLLPEHEHGWMSQGDHSVILETALDPNPSFFLFCGTFIRLGGLLGQELRLGLGPGLDNSDLGNYPTMIRFQNILSWCSSSKLWAYLDSVALPNRPDCLLPIRPLHINNANISNFNPLSIELLHYSILAWL